jgi:hypothetical protein
LGICPNQSSPTNSASETYNYVTYYFDDQVFTPRTVDEIDYLIKYLRGEIESFCVGSGTLPMIEFSGTGTTSPAPLPRIMPVIPHELHAKAATLIVAEEVANYPDLQLKLAYLLLEDKLGKDALKNDKLKFARDFVSHPFCDHTNVVSFIISELPSAEIIDITSAKAKVSFNRYNSDHIAFVFKYASLTLQRAKDLFNDEVVMSGGCIKIWNG